MKRSLMILLGICVCLSIQATVEFPNEIATTDTVPTDTVGDPFKVRPRVGLVLSGGGAKGVAHVGVIKALEENDIAIDCITGTSAGSIVGSLYACGWTPDQILAFFTSKDFSYWSTGTINPVNTYYFNKPSPTPQWMSVNLALRDSVSPFDGVIPSNLISPLPMNIEFLKLYSPYSRQCGEDFNKLFVPIRTVCSDVYHKHKIVCGNGSLGDAVRASMSFPLVFKPIELNGVLVYDGGIYDNFPVDVMQDEFNPEFIIGVSVSGPDSKPQAGNVYSQLEDMIIQNNNYDVPPAAGVKIQVPVLDFGVLDFDKARTIYEIGYRTGLEMVDSIKRRTSARRTLSEVNARRAEFRTRTPVIEFDSIAIEGATPGQQRFMETLFYRSRHPRVIGMNQVENTYYRLVTNGKLSDLLPQYVPESDGKNTLLLKATMKNPWYVGIGGWVTSSTNSLLYLTFGYHTMSLNSMDIDLSGWIGQSYYAARLAGKIALTTQIPSYMQLEAVFSRQKYYNSELLFYQINTPTFITDRQAFLKLTYGRAMGRRSVFTASFGAGLQSEKYYPTNKGDYAANDRDKSDYKVLNISAIYKYSTLDSELYPMMGEYFEAGITGNREAIRFYPGAQKKLRESLGDHYSLTARLEWKHFFELHRHFRLGLSAQGMATLSGLCQNYTATLVHSYAFGPTPSTKYYFNTAFRSNNFLAAGVSPIWNPVGQLQVRGDFYVYSPVRDLRLLSDGGCRYDGWFRRAEFIGEAAVVYNFKFASFSIYCNYLTNPAHNWNFGLSLGFPFHAPRL
ncbi:MAG: patatin-like phospholipase family protein [Muribaculum sp.]|nr:patatin-like phospholipase family protein [Muribaculum sp.]